MKRFLRYWPLAALLILLCVGSGYAILTNAFYDFVKISAPSNPPAGQGRLYVDSGTNKLACLNSDGSSCSPSGGGGGGFIQSLTAPVHGNFTQINFNTGAGVTTTEIDNASPVTSITIRQQDPNSTGQMAGMTKAKVAATFTVTAAFTTSGDLINPIAGLWLTDGSANNICFCTQFTVPLRIALFTNFAGNFSADIYNSGNAGGFFGTGPLVWFRVQETVSARNYYTSSDGINFTLVKTESNTAHFTTTQYGFVVEFRGVATTGDVETTMYSFAESNP